MNMKTWIVRQWNLLKPRRTFAAALALAVALSVGGYEVLKPAAATAATMAPAAPALDDSSVNAILTLDRAMENLAAHVTPAVVNVTVTSREKAQPVGQGDDDDQGDLR